MKFFCFGLGYTARYVLEALGSEAELIGGTCRTLDKLREYRQKRLPITLLDDVDVQKIREATHILVTIPPFEDAGDIVLEDFVNPILSNQNLQWLGYLSTTGVYGDHGGGWVDEETKSQPHSVRSSRRLDVEKAWLDLFKKHKTPVHIFRLAAIYGPGRSPFVDIENGRAKFIDKPGQYFNRTHVKDIAGMLAASMKKPTPGEIYNIADDMPCSALETQEYAAQLLGIDPPEPQPFDQVILSVMQREFYAANRRVTNHKIKDKLAYNLLYPTYKEGLKAIYEEEYQ